MMENIFPFPFSMLPKFIGFFIFYMQYFVKIVWWHIFLKYSNHKSAYAIISIVYDLYFPFQIPFAGSNGLLQCQELHRIFGNAQFLFLSKTAVVPALPGLLSNLSNIHMCFWPFALVQSYKNSFLIKSSSEFQWEHPSFPEYVSQRIYNQSIFPRFHG